MAITDREALGMGSLTSAVAAALEAGLPALMLREKDLPEDQLLPMAAELRALTARSRALFVINRRVAIARSVGADGVHLGADGPTLAEARSDLGAEAILGYSAHDINEALRAFEQGADYVIFSPIYETPSKRGVLQPAGLEALESLVKAAPGPVVALGGVDARNAAEVAGTGAAGVAVIRAIFASSSPRQATADLLQTWEKAAANRGAHSPSSRPSPSSPA